MKIEIDYMDYIEIYECIQHTFDEWLQENLDLLRLTDLKEDFIRASPILDRSIKMVCEMYQVDRKLNNYNVGLITGVCSVQFDVFASTFEWYRPMKRAIQKENQ